MADENKHEPHGSDKLFQWNLVPRWMLYSGLPRALGPTRWALFQALVQVDHQTMGLDNRRRGKDRQKFAVGNRELARISGVTDPRAALKWLRQSKLISYYRRGTGGEAKKTRWNEWGIDRATLLELYRYAAPRLTLSEGGVQTLDEREARQPKDGIQIYGLPNPNHMDIAGVNVPPAEVALLRDIATETEDPIAPTEVLRICGGP